MPFLPPPLAKPLVDKAGKIIGQVVLDLTLYLPAVDAATAAYLIDWYKRICPPDRLLQYAIPETQDWYDVDNPYLTKQGVAAELAGEPMPFLAPAFTRARTGRPFHVLFWDGRDTDMFTFSLRQIRGDDGALHAFVRVTTPATLDPLVLLAAARELADQTAFLSGHGGFAFGYVPDRKFDALSKIYPLARRYWGIDVEDMNGTLPRMGSAIKGPNWLTLLGAPFDDSPALVAAQAVPTEHPLLTVDKRTNGTLFIVSDSPVVGDRHRPGPDLAALAALGAALAPLIVRDHPSFSGDGFIDNSNTDGWFHRFDAPLGWS